MWNGTGTLPRRKTVRAFIVAAVVIVAAVIGVRGTVARLTVGQVQERTHPGWSYRAYREADGFVMAKVTYDRSTVAGVKAYAKANEASAQRQIARGQSTLEAEITFRRLLSADEFRAVMAQSGVPLSRISGYHIRALGTDGHWLTMGGAPTNGELISQTAVIDRQMSNLQRHDPDARLSGVAFADATLTPAEYQILLSHPDVFMIDVVKSEIRGDLKQRGVPISGERGLGVLRRTQPFWAMQQLGLENFVR